MRRMIAMESESLLQPLISQGMCPNGQSWLNFPLPFDDDNFEISDAQRGHASTIERFVPSLAALKSSLCPSYMSERCFWMIYFILVHPVLNGDDSELLASPQIVEAISLLEHQQQRQISTNTQLQSSKDDCSFLNVNSISSSIQERYGSVHVKQVSVNTVNAKELYNIIKWLGENGKVDTSINDRKQLSNGENVSFGHLDDDDENGFISHDCSRSLQDAWVSSSDVISSQYVELSQDSDDAHGTRRNNKSQPTSQGRNLEVGDLSDWFLIDDIDFGISETLSVC